MEIVQAASGRAAGSSRFTFLQKPVAAAAFIGLADMLFYRQWIGSTLGFFCLSLLVFLLIARPEILRHREGRIPALGAGAFVMVLGYDPSLLASALFALMLTLAVLLPRTGAFDDGWRWTKRLVLHWLRLPVAPLADWGRARAAARRRPLGIARNAHILLLPIGGSLLFLLLFARANPLIEDALARLDPAPSLSGLSIDRILFWLGGLILVWSVLRPPRLFRFSLEGAGLTLELPGISFASVTLSLLAFNALFAVQNALDIAFLWSGADLPAGMTLAEYAHRGAYPLIGTALLAALFVLLTLQPGTELAQSGVLKRLVYIWTGQNVLLVASTILRTLDYIDAYSLTRLRIAALIWMVLIAVGMFLICYRIWRSKSASWLINANLAAGLVAVSFCSVADLGRMAAGWNVRHAREVGGRGAQLDICYLRGLGASALMPMIELEGRTRNPVLKERVGWARIDAMHALAERQHHWRGWTLLGALRLAAAEKAIAQRQLPSAYGGWQVCDGSVPQGSSAPRLQATPPPPPLPPLTPARTR